jgi:hypothetical protein
MKITTSQHSRNGKNKEEEIKVSKELYRRSGFSRHLSKATVKANDVPVAHSAVLDVDLNIRRARGGASKLMLRERGVCVKGGERHSSCSLRNVSHGDIVSSFFLSTKYDS